MARRKKVRKRKVGQKLFFLILLIVAIVVGFLVYNAYFKDKEKVNESDKKIEENNSVIEKKEEKVEKKEENTNTDIKKENGIEVIDENDPNNSEYVTGRISSSGIKGDYFKITVITDQALSEGECLLKSIGDEKYNEVSDIVAHPNSSSCTFKLDKNIVKEGKYTAEILVTTTGDRTGTIRGEVER